MIKSKSRKYRAENKDVMQTRKSQHYPQRRKKIFEKQRNYYDKNVDFLIEKKKDLVTNQKTIPVKIEVNYLPN